MSTERVIVDKSIADDFEAALRLEAEAIQTKRFDLARTGAVDDLKTMVDSAVSEVRPAHHMGLTSMLKHS